MKYPKNKATTKNRVPGKSLKTKEKYIIDNFPLLKFDDWVRKRSMTLEAFKKSFWDLNDQYDTVSPEDDSYFCNCGSSRSIIDIYMIFKYYYKNITLKEVMEFVFYSTMIEGVFICNDVLRRVHYRENRYGETERDELGYNSEEFLKEIMK